MNHSLLRLVVIICGLLSFRTEAQPEAMNMQLIASAAKNSILVTFFDRTITRRPMASLSGSYRRVYNYKSSTWSKIRAARLAKQYQLKRLLEWPITELGVQCVVYEVPADKSVKDVLDALASDELVESAQRMMIFDMHTAKSNYKDPYYMLQTSMRVLQLEKVHQLTTGKNIQIALIDTGVDYQHPDLKGQVIPATNFAADFSKSFLDDVHGTTVAGIIAARANNGIGIVGVAPDTQVIALKACWSRQQDTFQASCNSLTLALAINRAIKMGADIINLSLGGPPDPLVGRLIDAAIAKGIVVIAADPGQHQAGQRFPASMANVIAVHTTPHAGEGISRDSAKHYQWITAPGIGILTTIPQASYDFISGCSIAAAHVSGIVALLLEINPDLTPHNILKLLNATRKQVDTNGAGEIDILTAISSLHAGLGPVTK